MANLEEIKRGAPLRATSSYLIPVGDLSLEDRQALRRDADRKLIMNALDARIKSDDKDLLIRDTLPNTDLGLAAQEDWLIAGAGILATELQYLSAAVANNRVIGFFGVSVESAPASISRLRLTLGAASAQTRGSYQLEQLYSRLEPAGYFSELVQFVQIEVCRIMVMPRLAFVANSERLAFMARTVEPIGGVISTASV